MGRATFTVTLNSTGHQKSATTTISEIKEGFWLNENDEELKQINGLTKNILFGEKVKIKLITENTSDGKEIEVEIKATINGKYVDFTNDKEGLKFLLTVRNNEAILEPFYLNPKWYNEEKENYNYDAKYKGQDKEHGRIDLPKDDALKLKPVTYLRNYEELIGLFNTDNSGNKDKENNYENKFIDSNVEIKTIVDEFIEKVTTPDITISDIKTLVQENAKVLWETAVKQVQGGNLDDRPLYWARNKMQTWLKRNPIFKDQIDIKKSLVKKGTELDKIIILFEEKSRNYTGIDFSKAGDKKKVLITGFDPFLLNSFDHKYKKYYNILQSNPSGVVTLALNNDDTLGAFIQTMMFPVRYLDFDGSNSPTKGIGEGVVEKHIKPLISGVDAIITISQAGPDEYNIDVFGTLTRGGGDENLNYTRESLSKAISTDLEWIKTTLNSGFTDAKEVKYEWTYNFFEDGKINPPREEDEMESGSGSNYLSNEIFYRVGKMRTELKPNLETGHFHISKIQNEKKEEDLNPLEIEEVLEIVKKSLNQGIKQLK